MKKLITALLLVSTQVSLAAPIVKSWTNPQCASGDCEVKGIKLFVEKFNSSRDRMAGNYASMEIETSRPELLKEYAFVQYIKGCMVLVSNLGETRMVTREFFGKSGQPFLHKTWELDSASDTDPLYWSNNKAGYDELRGFEIPRNSYYVNDNPLLTDKYGSFAGKLKNLKSNKIYADDFPTPSFWEESNGIVTARTSSLDFKVCLHKIKEVPASVNDPKTIIPAPIACLDWSSNYQFDFTKKVFTERTSMHSACK